MAVSPPPIFALAFLRAFGIASLLAPGITFLLAGPGITFLLALHFTLCPCGGCSHAHSGTERGYCNCMREGGSTRDICLRQIVTCLFLFAHVRSPSLC